MASAVDSRLAYARLSAVATASRLPTANRGSNNSYTTSWDTTYWWNRFGPLFAAEIERFTQSESISESETHSHDISSSGREALTV